MPDYGAEIKKLFRGYQGIVKKSLNREFRKVPSLQFLYEVNGDGTILRNVKSKKHIKIKLDMHHSSVGYYFAWVNIKHKVIRVPIHRIVAECWLGEKPRGYEIDHIDRNSHNNAYTNLRYVTHSEQMKNRVMSDRLIGIATQNCLRYVKSISVPVVVSNSESSVRFDSMTAAAAFIGASVGVDAESVRARMKKRRSHILGFDCTYLNAETKRVNLKG